MKHSTYDVSDKMITNEDAKKYPSADLSALVESYSYLPISSNHGFVVTFEKQDNKVKVTVVSPESKINIFESEDNCLSNAEFKSIAVVLNDEVQSAQSSEKKESPYLSDIAALNNMQFSYSGQMDDNMFGTNMDVYNFLRDANNYFYTMGDRCSNQKFVFVHSGDERAEAVDTIMKKAEQCKSQMSVTFFVESNEPDLTVYRREALEDGTFEISEKPYEVDPKFKSIMSSTNGEQYSKALLAYLMLNMDDNRIVNNEIYGVKTLDDVSRVISESSIDTEEVCKLVKMLVDMANEHDTYTSQDTKTYNDALERIVNHIVDKERRIDLINYTNFHAPAAISEVNKIGEAIGILDDRDREQARRISQIKDRKINIIKETKPKTKKRRGKLDMRRVKGCASAAAAAVVVAAGGVTAYLKGPSIVDWVKSNILTFGDDRDNPSGDSEKEPIIVPEDPEVSHVDVYKEPNVDSEIAGKIDDDTVLTICAADLDMYANPDGSVWVKIGDEEWIMHDYLKMETFRVNTRDDDRTVRIRAVPDVNSDIIYDVPNGDFIQIKSHKIETPNDREDLRSWYQVGYSDEYGIQYEGYTAAAYIDYECVVDADVVVSIEDMKSKPQFVETSGASEPQSISSSANIVSMEGTNIPRAVEDDEQER